MGMFPKLKAMGLNKNGHRNTKKLLAFTYDFLPRFVLFPPSLVSTLVFEQHRQKLYPARSKTYNRYNISFVWWYFS